MLRAYDKATGTDVGAVYMPAPQTGSPMTYLLNGKQYITVSVSAPGFPGELIAYGWGSRVLGSGFYVLGFRFWLPSSDRQPDRRLHSVLPGRH